MLNFNKILKLSKQIAGALLKDEPPNALGQTNEFTEQDKQLIIKRLTNAKHIEKRLRLKQSIDTQAQWQVLKSKIQTPVKRLYWPYAAAAAVVLAIGLTWYMAYNNGNSATVPTTTIVNTIPAGTDQAKLTLEDGTEVVLEQGTQFNRNHVHSTNKGLYYDVQNPDTLQQVVFNYLSIPRGGQFSLTLADGTQVWLNSETKIKYPVLFKAGQTRNVELLYGEAYFDVSPSTAHQGASFKVRAKGQEIEVLGTEFNIKAYQDEQHIYSTLVEGKIAVSTSTQNDILQPGEQAVLFNNAITVKTVDVFNETAWRKGVFSFKDMPLKNIMTVLSRWYNVNVVFDNKQLENETFTGVLGREQSLQEILSIISDINKIEYEINTNTVQFK